MIKRMAVIALLVSAMVLATVGCSPEAEPPAPADFYKGKTIDFVTAGSPGGYTDLLTRTIAPYLARDTGATVAVTNRRGAGGLEGMNYLYKGKPDGLTLGTVSAVKFVANKLLQEPAAEYEIEDFSYIMSLGCRLHFFFLSPDGPYRTVADLQSAKGLKIGGGSASGSVSLGGLTVIRLLGLDAKVVTGIEGEPDRALMVKRGEVVGYCQNLGSTQTSVDSGMVTPMFVLATERDSFRPDVPAITELVSLSSDDLALVRLWETAFTGSTLFAAPPGLPADRLVFLREMADGWVNDDEFRREIDLVSGFEVQPQEYVTGDEVSRSMLDIADALGEFQATFADLIENYRA
jgi:tripartite-type tricarboxylate transporter receptor subunit TctC